MRRSLPRLSSFTAESFEGTPAIRTLKPGDILYCGENIGQDYMSNFYGKTALQSSLKADEFYNIFKQGNKAQVLTNYEVTKEVTIYGGKVAGGKGVQILIPEDVDPNIVLKRVSTTSLPEK